MVKKEQNIWKRLIVIVIVSFCCIGCDQSSKHIASEHLTKNTVTSYLSDTIRIGYTENKGAFLGIGKDMPEQLRFLVFTVFVGIFLTLFLFYLVLSTPLNIYTLVGLSCIFSGGASNFADRATNNGAVVDFLNVGVGSLRTGIFNIADVAILLGVALFFFGSYYKPENEVTW